MAELDEGELLEPDYVEVEPDVDGLLDMTDERDVAAVAN